MKIAEYASAGKNRISHHSTSPAAAWIRSPNVTTMRIGKSSRTLATPAMSAATGTHKVATIAAMTHRRPIELR